ncbi:MAG TPA: HigA family addiction module antitoxin [Candidatus Obscuribacterales bacterium]
MSKSLPENRYFPDYVSPPGETLLETMEMLGLTQAQVADRIGKTPKTINEIVQGKSAITAETALQLERVTNVPASFWNNREAHYREFLARQQERQRLEGQTDWLSKLPIKDMIKFGCIQKKADRVDQLLAVLNFLGVASPDRIECAVPIGFRKSPTFKSDRLSLVCWLRWGDIEAHRIHCSPYSADSLKAALPELRKLSNDSADILKVRLPEICARAGVAVVMLPEFSKCRVSGAARWLTSEKAVIQLSLRYKTDDHLWFTLFHEIGHILLHGKKEIFIDETLDNDPIENEANQFASRTLIPTLEYKAFVSAGNFSIQAIKSFAAALDVAPGIVVGRLQFDKHLDFDERNQLKQRFQWVAD